MTSMLLAAAVAQATFARLARDDVASLRKMKRIALATLMYAQDNGERLPRANGYRATLMPDLKDSAAFTAPDAAPGVVSDYLDPRLSGIKPNGPPFPAEIAMILQGSPGKSIFPYGEKLRGFPRWPRKDRRPRPVGKSPALSR